MTDINTTVKLNDGNEMPQLGFGVFEIHELEAELVMASRAQSKFCQTAESPLTVMVGLELDGSVRTVIVTANTETPGLGTAVTDRKVQKTIADLIQGGEAAEGLAPNKFLDWYAGKKAEAEPWDIVKDVEPINGKTGATITSSAICGAVHAISKTAIDNLESLKD